VIPGFSGHTIAMSTSVPVAPIRVVDITRRHTPGVARFTHSDLDAPVLGAVIRYEHLHGLLVKAIAGSSGHRSPSDASEPRSRPANPSPALTIIADGETDSATTRRHDFGQMALTAEVVTSRDQPGVAFERFTAEGPLALLPLPEPGRRALVWCAPESLARRRAHARVEDFDRELAECFGPLLGILRLDGARHVSPLIRRIGPLQRDATSLAIGNAAQSLHPVAGQGLNLGLRDASSLASHLGDVHSNRHDLAHAVTRFVQSRTADRESVTRITDLLATLTCPEPLRPAHATGLALLDLCAPLRRQVARGFMHGVRLPPFPLV
jgi:2-octaprenyl-6-methoxyphenol hydroxylase